MQAGLQVLVVHLWGSRARVVYHSKSHLHLLNSVQAANGLFEIPLANLGRVGSIGKELVFEKAACKSHTLYSSHALTQPLGPS
jgi:hypothetical protein